LFNSGIPLSHILRSSSDITAGNFVLKRYKDTSFISNIFSHKSIFYPVPQIPLQNPYGKPVETNISVGRNRPIAPVATTELQYIVLYIVLSETLI
jgi:hypothetical protein